MFTFLRRFAWFGRDESPRTLALRALRLGSLDEAERRFDELIPVSQTAGERALLHNKRGVVRVARGCRDEALDDFNAALLAVPNYAPALTNIGNLLLEDGAVDEAIVHYEAAIRADDEYAIAHQNLAIALKRLGHHADAVRELRRAHRLEGRLFGSRFGWRRRW
jgi:tetratricopeptide (TPR) repeat protein